MISVVLHPLPLTVGGRHTNYRVTLNGAIIVNSSHQPGYDAARALLKAGFSGPFQTLDEKTGKVRMTFPSIAGAAKLTVVDDESGMRLRRFRAFSGSAVQHRTAEDTLGSTETPPEQEGLPE